MAIREPVFVLAHGVEAVFASGTMELAPDFVVFFRPGHHMCLFRKSSIERIYTASGVIEVPKDE